MQLDIFSIIREKYKITKPIRLIELFAGIGSQAKALKMAGIPFEHYRICEFDKYAVASYNAVHGTNFETSDITKISCQDLGIVNTESYEYILTYSFPCTDLSLAGKQEGMKKGSGTRSGLLWEVERLLTECKELPQILLMENVPEVIGQNNVFDFNEWQRGLEYLGYSNYIKVLNAKDFGVPQNRNRCYMVSLLGNYSYTFPQKQNLTLRLKDMLEEEVDEKYYLSEKMINGMIKTSFESYKLENKLKDYNGIADTIISRFEGTPQCITIPEATKKGYVEAHEGDGVYINRPQQKRGVVQKQMIQTIKAQSDDIGVVVKNKPIIPFGSYYTWEDNQGNINTQCNRAAEPNNYALTVACAEPGKVLDNLRIRKLTPKECWRLMGFYDEDYEKASKVNSNAQLYKQAGNSIVVNVLEAIFKELFSPQG